MKSGAQFFKAKLKKKKKKKAAENQRSLDKSTYYPQNLLTFAGFGGVYNLPEQFHYFLFGINTMRFIQPVTFVYIDPKQAILI